MFCASEIALLASWNCCVKRFPFSKEVESFFSLTSLNNSKLQEARSRKEKKNPPKKPPLILFIFQNLSNLERDVFLFEERDGAKEPFEILHQLEEIGGSFLSIAPEGKRNPPAVT